METAGVKNDFVPVSKGIWGRTLRPVYRLLIGIILLAALTQFVDPTAIWSAFGQASALPLAVASLLTIFNLGFQILKWNYLLNIRAGGSTVKKSAKSFFFGMTLGLLSPGQLGEFGGRAWQWEGDSPVRILGLALLDRLQAFLVICLGGIVSTALIFFPQSLAMLATGIVLASLAAHLFFAPQSIKRLLLAAGAGRLKYAWARDLLNLFDDFRIGQLLLMFVLTALFYGTIFLQLHFLINAFAESSFSQSFLGFSTMMLYKSFLPISLGDLGVREATSVFVFSLINIPKPAVFNASLLLFVLNILLPAVIGLFSLPSSSQIIPSHRQSRSEAP